MWLWCLKNSQGTPPCTGFKLRCHLCKPPMQKSFQAVKKDYSEVLLSWAAVTCACLHLHINVIFFLISDRKLQIVQEPCFLQHKRTGSRWVASISQSPERTYFFLFVLSRALRRPCDSNIKRVWLHEEWSSLMPLCFSAFDFLAGQILTRTAACHLQTRSLFWVFVWNRRVCGQECDKQLCRSGGQRRDGVPWWETCGLVTKIIVGLRGIRGIRRH